MDCISNAEKAILEKMCPVGCRIELISLEDKLHRKLVPGDMGTVKTIDTKGIQVAWDKGVSHALSYQGDKFNCIMAENEFTEFLVKLNGTRFASMDSLQGYMEEHLLKAFPEMYFRPAVNNQIILELGCNTFKGNTVNLQYRQDGMRYVYVTEVNR